MKVLKGIGCVVFAITGLVQWAATFAGLEAWLHIPWWISGPVGFTVGGFPIIGTVTGVMGAIKGWGWSLWGAIALFGWPYALYLVIGLGGGLADLGARLFRRKPRIADGDVRPYHVARLSKWVHVVLSTVLLLAGTVLAGGVGVAVMRADNTQGSVQWNALALLSGGVIMVIASVILNLVCMHKAWSAIQDGHARTTPGKAVGFMFIPLFNFYWVFQSIWGFAKDYNSFLSRHDVSQPRLTEWMYLVLAISFGVGNVIAALGGLSLLAYLVFLPIVLCSVCNAINRLSDGLAGSVRESESS